MEQYGNKNPNRALQAADQIARHLFRSGGWAELAAVAQATAPHPGDVALQDTIEIEPIQFPHGLELCDPPEHGWRYRAAEIPDQAA